MTFQARPNASVQWVESSCDVTAGCNFSSLEFLEKHEEYGVSDIDWESPMVLTRYQPAAIVPPTELTLDGNASTDFEGGVITSYHWYPYRRVSSIQGGLTLHASLTRSDGDGVLLVPDYSSRCLRNRNLFGCRNRTTGTARVIIYSTSALGQHEFSLRYRQENCVVHTEVHA